MVKIKDLVSIEKDTFFDGAVQSDWFYNNSMRDKVAKKYIFHGPKYYGVNQKDIKDSRHKLIDTASFVNNIYDKIYNNYSSSRFALTVAGYGAGKSHLSLTLATLLSNINFEVRNNIIENLKTADKEIGEKIEELNDKNFVIVLNGINDFNLNSEILKSAKKTLEMYNLDDNIFDDMSLAYKSAESFIDRMYSILVEKFEKIASDFSKYKMLKGGMLKKTLKDNISDDIEAFTIVNKVFELSTGNSIKIEQAISANTILTKIHERYVIKEKKFKSVVIIFDEFGRYLEYASLHPSIAGETAIQQIFEATQNCKPSMIFIGFIQSDLSTYLARVNNDNIIRYVGRYEGSDKYYLSSNLETVIASLVQKNGKRAEEIIGNIFDNTLSNYTNKLFNNINRWIPELSSKSVWSNNNMFSKVILKGCYPVHPITTSFLLSLSVWMQQRSTLSFISDIFSTYNDREIGEEIPFIDAVSVVNSPIFYELLNAEERGRQQGQNCIKYSEVIEEYGERLTPREKNILASILILNIVKFKIYNKDDCITALESCMKYAQNGIRNELENLEEVLGIIYYDDTLNRYQFMNSGNSKIDFNKEFIKKKTFVRKDNLIDSIPEGLRKEMNIVNPELTSFGIKNHIGTQEWGFQKRFVSINDFTDSYAKNFIRDLDRRVSPEIPKGEVIFLYCNSESYECVKSVINIYVNNNLEEYPVLIFLINDTNNIIKNSLIDFKTLELFDATERDKYSKYINEKKLSTSKKIIRTFMELAQNKQLISNEGIIILKERLKESCLKKFREIYSKTVPFSFDGFEKKLTAKQKNNYYSILEILLLRKFENPIEFNSLNVELKNRINILLNVDSIKSWKILYNNSIIEAQNSSVRAIADEMIRDLKKNNELGFVKIINKYTRKPYGLNIYSVTLMFVYVMVLNKENILLVENSMVKKRTELINHFYNDKKEAFVDFAKYSLRYVDKIEENDINSFLSKLDKSSGISIEKCEDLLLECNKLIDEDISDENMGRLLHHRDILQRAVNKNREINEAIKLALKNLQNINISLAMSSYNNIKEIKGGFIKDTNYTYSSEQVEKANNIKKTSIEYIKNNYERIEKNTSLDRLAECQRLFKIVVRFLKNVGELSLAEEVEKLIEVSKNRLLVGRQIEKEKVQLNDNLNKIEMEIKLSDDLNKVKNELDVIIGTASKNENFKIQLDRANKMKSNIEETIEKSYKYLHYLIQQINEVDSLEKLKNVLNYIMSTSRESLVSDVRLELNKYESEINKIYYELKALENKDISIQNLECSIFQLKKHLNIMILNKSVDKIYETLKQLLIKKEEAWCKKNILDDLQINNMLSDDLLKWKNTTIGTLDNFSNETLQKYNESLKKVNKKLSEYKLENIIQLFNELSISEREKCLGILNRII